MRNTAGSGEAGSSIFIGEILVNRSYSRFDDFFRLGVLKNFQSFKSTLTFDLFGWKHIRNVFDNNISYEDDSHEDLKGTIVRFWMLDDVGLQV